MGRLFEFVSILILAGAFWAVMIGAVLFAIGVVR